MPKKKGEPEALTRKNRIDAKLDTLGWAFAKDGEEPKTGPYRKEEVETGNGPADYLLYLNRKLVGIIEAKKLSLGRQNVLTQAERYAQGEELEGAYATNGFAAPFLYSTNGEV